MLLGVHERLETDRHGPEGGMKTKLRRRCRRRYEARDEGMSNLAEARNIALAQLLEADEPAEGERCLNNRQRPSDLANVGARRARWRIGKGNEPAEREWSLRKEDLHLAFLEASTSERLCERLVETKVGRRCRDRRRARIGELPDDLAAHR